MIEMGCIENEVSSDDLVLICALENVMNMILQKLNIQKIIKKTL